MNISPKYMMQLISKIENEIWTEFTSYKNAEGYISRWHEEYDGYGQPENFAILRKEHGKFDLPATLQGIQDDELLLKIAIDLGIEIPDLVYSIPEIKGILSSGYETAASTFEQALKKVHDEPATSVACANSALESIIKHICQDNSFSDCNPKDTLYDLAQHILREFKFYPSKEMESEIRNIGSSLLNASKNIEAMRSKYADTTHGKTAEDYIIDDPLYAKFIVNSVTTIGLFLLNFYGSKYANKNGYDPHYDVSEDDIPF